MTDILEEICARRRDHISRAQRRRPLSEVREAAKKAPPVRNFETALHEKVQSHGAAIIAELKKASPSAGLIRPDFVPANCAQLYENAGAAALSVLTEPDYFSGSPDFLKAAREATDLPVLRKDFMLAPYQIYESRAMGADAVLLIMAALPPSDASEMEEIARQLGMAVLLEVHTLAEMEIALRTLSTPLVGINNRNLKTMKTDIKTSVELASRLPKDRFGVAESGIKTPEDIKYLKKAGIDRFLIGETLMKKPDPGRELRRLLPLDPGGEPK